jgi:predicted RNase H-like HicB family nuclease
MEYPVYLEYDLSTGTWMAVAPTFESAFTQGPTQEQALASIRELIVLALEDVEEEGYPTRQTDMAITWLDVPLPDPER